MAPLTEAQDVEHIDPLSVIQRPVGNPELEKIQNTQKKGLLIFHVTTSDPAGAAYNLVRAVNAHTIHRARLITTAPNTYGHPRDIYDIHDYGDEFEALLVDADVLHFHKINEDVEVEFASSKSRSWQIKDFLIVNGKKKKLVYHVHGHPYERANVEENGKDYAQRSGRVLASTPDLVQMYKPYCDIQYFPNCVPINDPKYLPRQTDRILEDKSGIKRYIVCHTVSDPILKDSIMIEKAVNYVGRTQPVNLMTIEKTPFELTMGRKRLAHVVFDHMQGYYGLASLEGLSMGKPVIAGLDDNTIKHILDFFKIPDILPWQRPRDQKGLNDCVMDLIANPEMMSHIGKLGRSFMETIWSDYAIAQKAARLYESL